MFFDSGHKGRVLLGLVLFLWLLIAPAYRLPAPVIEIEESPSPQTESNKPRTHHSKSKATTPVPTVAGPVTPVPPTNQAGFAGIWVGTARISVWGSVQFTFIINSNGTTVREKSRLGAVTHPATCDGKIVSFHSGALNETGWTLTPNADGRTAAVTCKGLLVGDQSITFQKQANSETTVAAILKPQSEIPKAKPVPGKPGYVYDPFDPSSIRILDARNIERGTKVQDPLSGKSFIVP